MATRGKSDVMEHYEHAQELIDDAAARDELYDKLDALYDQVDERASDDPESIQRMTMPYATNAIDLITDLAADMKLSITVPAAKESDKAMRLADDQEAWLRAWHSQNERVQRHNLTADGAWLAAQRACVAYKTIFTDALLYDAEDGKRPRNVPVLLQSRDPRHLYWEEGPSSLACIVEVLPRKVRDLRRLYPNALAKKDYEDDQIVEWLEYWDEKICIYFADGEPVRVGGQLARPHRYGIVPYAIGVGRQTPRRGAVRKYRPLLAAVYSLLHNIDTWYTILATAGWGAQTNSWVIFSENEPVLNFEPDAVNYLRPGDKLQAIQRAEMPPDFFRLGGQMIEAMQQGTFPLAMFGQLPGQMAGYAINLLTSSGRRPLVPIWKSIAMGYEQAFYNALRICREVVAPLVGGDVPLMVQAGVERAGGGERMVRRALTLDAAAIGDDWDCDVTFSDPLPSDAAANVRLALETTAGDNPLLSHMTALEKFKIVTDSLAEQDRIHLERIIGKLAEQVYTRVAVERGYLPAEVLQPPPAPLQEMMPPGMRVEPQLNAAEMQAMAGQAQQMPDLAQMAGVAPGMPEQVIG